MKLFVPITLLSLLAALFPAAVAQGTEQMMLGGQTSQPIGHYYFCKKSPEECRATLFNENLRLTPILWDQVVKINLAVNKQVKPKSDFDHLSVEEDWAYPDDNIGDCEDYALEKRRQLIKSGIPPGNLVLTVVRKQDGEGHAVLTLVLASKDLILDNLDPRIRDWHKVGYTFLKRQASLHAGWWVSIRKRDVALTPVASVE